MPVTSCFRRVPVVVRATVVTALVLTCTSAASAPAAHALVSAPGAAASQSAAPAAGGGSSLETAASKAGDTGRKVAMSLIGLAFAVAGIVLAFRRDFKEAAGVFAVGVVAVLLATQAGVSLLKDTVASLFGTQ